MTVIALCAAAVLPLALVGASLGDGRPLQNPDGAPPAVVQAPVEIPGTELNRLIQPAGYACPLPDLDIPSTEACAQGRSYPECKWQVPKEADAGGLYKVWWRTPPEELWGRSALVRLVLSSIALFRTQHPDDELYVGDLDAPESRHMSHREGVDVDIYLLRWMEWIQVKDAKYEDNMAWRPPESKALARKKVLDLARALAVCSSGKLQIYYNDTEVIEPFGAWFEASGYLSPLGSAMTAHNDTHHDHFHVRIPTPADM